jgi:hypothetical protein
MEENYSQNPEGIDGPRDDISLTSQESSAREMDTDESEISDADDCVDLEVTMWQVLRKNKAKNEYLKKLHSNVCKAEIYQGDIMKFGRVNFRLVEVNSVRLATRSQAE